MDEHGLQLFSMFGHLKHSKMAQGRDLFATICMSTVFIFQSSVRTTLPGFPSSVTTMNRGSSNPNKHANKEPPCWLQHNQKKQTHVYSDLDRALFLVRTFDKKRLLCLKGSKIQWSLGSSNSYEKSDMKVFPRSYPRKFFEFSVKHQERCFTLEIWHI